MRSGPGRAADLLSVYIIANIKKNSSTFLEKNRNLPPIFQPHQAGGMEGR